MPWTISDNRCWMGHFVRVTTVEFHQGQKHHAERERERERERREQGGNARKRSGGADSRGDIGASRLQ
jgi:hypothetical protein